MQRVLRIMAPCGLLAIAVAGLGGCSTPEEDTPRPLTQFVTLSNAEGMKRIRYPDGVECVTARANLNGGVSIDCNWPDERTAVE